ncbi:hypothetical protein [Anaeromyxobacter oryzae]|uniref:hypothetical protein n=1 Tax=Anaeromyxobacter oryzae TaxID=2918170 RepID=UPI0020C0B5F2|nr:hypothetical protein [Anaeromyxobacter oryzae]
MLVVAPEGGDADDLFRELRGRPDLQVLSAATAAAAAERLREAAVCLLIASPDVATSAVSELLASKERVRPELPVLVIRNRQAEEPEGWIGRGVGVLRCPLVAGALRRSVDVVLGLDLHG